MKPFLTDFKHFAILNTAFLGDVAISLQLASILKVNHPDCTISFVTTPEAKVIAELSPDIYDVIDFDKKDKHRTFSGMWKLAWQIKESGVDCIISTHKSARSSILTAMANPRFSLGFNNSELSFLYKKRAEYYFHLHEQVRLVHLLNTFAGEIKSSVKPKLRFKVEIISKVEQILTGNINAKPILLLAPGSVWETKRWLPEYFAQIAVNLGYEYNVIIIGGNQDQKLAEMITKNSSARSLCGDLSIPESIYLMTKSELLITNDSAPTHFANLAGCPVGVIYGPTSPMFGFYPQGGADISIQMENLKCRPCAIHGGKSCPLGTHECMKLLTPEIVLNNLKSNGLLKRLLD